MALAGQSSGEGNALPLPSPFDQQFMNYKGDIHRVQLPRDCL